MTSIFISSNDDCPDNIKERIRGAFEGIGVETSEPVSTIPGDSLSLLSSCDDVVCLLSKSYLSSESRMGVIHYVQENAKETKQQIYFIVIDESDRPNNYFFGGGRLYNLNELGNLIHDYRMDKE